VSDAVLEKEYVFSHLRFSSGFNNLCRKNRDVAEVFAPGFSWPAAIDSAADVYNGVSTSFKNMQLRSNSVAVCLLVHGHLLGSYRLV
jgi:hypothetical protein